MAVTKPRQSVKIRAVELLGDRCIVCSYEKHPGVLEPHRQTTNRVFGRRPECSVSSRTANTGKSLAQ